MTENANSLQPCELCREMGPGQPMDSPGELQLARKHVVVFVVLVSELSWEGGQSSQEAEWKIPCQIPVLLTVVWGRAFTMLFVLFFPGSGRRLLSGI